MEDLKYTWWLMAIILTLQVNSCTADLQQQRVISELREIKMELKK